MADLRRDEAQLSAQLSAPHIAAIEYQEQELRDAPDAMARMLTAPARLQRHTIATERPFVLSEMLGEKAVSSVHEGTMVDALRETTQLQCQFSLQVRKGTGGRQAFTAHVVWCGVCHCDRSLWWEQSSMASLLSQCFRTRSAHRQVGTIAAPSTARLCKPNESVRRMTCACCVSV